MAWEKLDPALASHDLVQDLKWNPRLREQFKRDEAAVLDQYDLKPEERKAIEARDFRRLYDLGIHPYLGGQLARLIYGNDAGKGAIEAADKLVASLTGTREAAGYVRKRTEKPAGEAEDRHSRFQTAKENARAGDIDDEGKKG